MVTKKKKKTEIRIIIKRVPSGIITMLPHIPNLVIWQSRYDRTFPNIYLVIGVDMAMV